MSTIEDLSSKSILDLSFSEGVELIRQIRMSRRTPKKTTQKRAQAKAVRKPKKVKPSSLSPAEAAQLLELLESMG